MSIGKDSIFGINILNSTRSPAASTKANEKAIRVTHYSHCWRYHSGVSSSIRKDVLRFILRWGITPRPLDSGPSGAPFRLEKLVSQ